MKKLLLSLAMMLTFTMAANAVPARPGLWKMITLSDGTQVRAELKGDEYCHFFQAEDGRTFMQVDAQNVYTQISRAEIAKRAMTARQESNDPIASGRHLSAPKKIVLGSKHEPYIGKKRCLCILVEFADVKFKDTHTLDMYKEYINGKNITNPEHGKTQTVHEYFVEQSGGKFEIEFDVVGPYTLGNSCQYYGANVGGNDNSMRVQGMVTTAFNLANDDVDYSQYDWDGDGATEPIFILYAGYGEADSHDPNTIWPHKGSIYSQTKRDGMVMQEYACASELRYDGALAGIGTMCHEYSHCLGLPDLYDTQYEGNVGMGKYDIMESGSYLPDSKATNPAGFSAYEKMYAGWLKPTELGLEAMKVENMKPLTRADEAYVIYNPRNHDEYYLIENRKKENSDASIPGEGLLIYHIDFDGDAWAGNYVNSPGATIFSDHCRMQVVPSDNEKSITEYAVYPSKSSVLTLNSTPAPKLYRANSDGTFFLNMTIKDIKKNADGTISFNYLPEPLGKTQAPEGAVFYESFDNSYGLGGNDGLFLAPEQDGTGWTPLSFVADNEGITTQAGFAGYQCAGFGKSTGRGAAVMPPLEFSGTYNLTFKAAPYNNEATKVNLAGTGITFGQKAFTLNADGWTECSTTFTANGKLKMQFVSDVKRFFLDEVLITKSDADGIQNITAEQDVANAKAYNLAGQRINANAANKGIMIINGKKVIK